MEVRVPVDCVELHVIEKVGICQLEMSIYVEHWGNNLQFYPNFALF